MIKKLFTITFLLTLSLFSFCQENFTCKSSDGKGDITFNTVSKQISYNFPEFKSQISNFILLSKDNSYPSSVVERFSCNDEKNDKWVLCLVFTYFNQA